MLVLIDCVLWVILGRMEPTVEPISRRMANLGYIVWMVGHVYTIEIVNQLSGHMSINPYGYALFQIICIHFVPTIFK